MVSPQLNSRKRGLLIQGWHYPSSNNFHGMMISRVTKKGVALKRNHNSAVAQMCLWTLRWWFAARILGTNPGFWGKMEGLEIFFIINSFVLSQEVGRFEALVPSAFLLCSSIDSYWGKWSSTGISDEPSSSRSQSALIMMMLAFINIIIFFFFARYWFSYERWQCSPLFRIFGYIWDQQIKYQGYHSLSDFTLCHYWLLTMQSHKSCLLLKNARCFTN